MTIIVFLLLSPNLWQEFVYLTILHWVDCGHLIDRHSIFWDISTKIQDLLSIGHFIYILPSDSLLLHLLDNNEVFMLLIFCLMQISMFYFYLRTELNIIHPFQATKEFVGFHWVSFMSDVSIIKHPPAAAWQLTAAKQGSNILGPLPSFHPNATCNLSRRDSSEWWKQLFSLQFSPDNEWYIRSSMCWPAATIWTQLLLVPASPVVTG